MTKNKTGGTFTTREAKQPVVALIIMGRDLDVALVEQLGRGDEHES